jgi:hypothetical protein
MFEPFTLVIPADPKFHPMASDLAGRLAELAGGSAGDLSAQVTKALQALAANAAAGDQVRMTFRPADRSVGVDLTCGSQSTTITSPL